jgi:hypothetical protein
VEKCLGSSLPPAELASAGFRRFREKKCLFSIAPEARKGSESPECFSLKTLTGRGPSLTGRVRSVQHGVGTRVCNRRIRSLTELERPVGHPEGQSVAKS